MPRDRNSGSIDAVCFNLLGNTLIAPDDSCIKPCGSTDDLRYGNERIGPMISWLDPHLSVISFFASSWRLVLSDSNIKTNKLGIKQINIKIPTIRSFMVVALRDLNDKLFNASIQLASYTTFQKDQ